MAVQGEQEGSKKRQFCAAFPEDVSQYFQSLSSFSQDEIEGHMYMFSKELNGEHYTKMLQTVTEFLGNELSKGSHVRFEGGD
jgi:hypothetical protein